MIGTPGSRAICYDAIPNIVYKWKTSKRTVSATWIPEKYDVPKNLIEKFDRCAHLAADLWLSRE